jgi:hypothetical protein
LWRKWPAPTILARNDDLEFHVNTRAIHVVWITYLTWLPGDARGHWSPLMDFYGRLIHAGHQLNIADDGTLATARHLAKGPAISLRESEVAVVADTIAEVLRGGLTVGAVGGLPAAAWTAHAAAIETQHVHLLLAANREPIRLFVGRAKGKSSSRINAANGTSGQPIGTAGFWRGFLFDWAAVKAARDYVVNHNLRRGLPAYPFDWITPLPTEV